MLFFKSLNPVQKLLLNNRIPPIPVNHIRNMANRIRNEILLHNPPSEHRPPRPRHPPIPQFAQAFAPPFYNNFFSY